MIHRRGRTSLFLRYTSRMEPSSALLMNAFSESIFAREIPAISDASTITYPKQTFDPLAGASVEVQPVRKVSRLGKYLTQQRAFADPLFPDQDQDFIQLAAGPPCSLDRAD